MRIVDLTTGKFLPGDRETMKPSSLLTVFGERISRVAICGTVVERYDSGGGNFSSLTIDDGTDAIHVKAFNEGVDSIRGISNGDFVIVVGKIKGYMDENFVVPEIVKRVNDPNFETFWKLERLNEIYEKKKVIDGIKNMQSQMNFEEIAEYAKEKLGIEEEGLRFVLEGTKMEVDYKPQILDLIEKSDEGSGVEIAKLLELSNLDENIVENTLNELIAEGAVYEPSVGKLKKV